MSPSRKRVLPTDDGLSVGGVFVLRAWLGPDNEIVGRMQWSVEDNEEHAYAAGTNAIIRALHDFLHLVEADERQADSDA
jgi:hypothetical protein